jgi:hypothetical protein
MGDGSLKTQKKVEPSPSDPRPGIDAATDNAGEETASDAVT